MISHAQYLKYMEWAKAQGELFRNSEEAWDEFLEFTGLKEFWPEIVVILRQRSKRQEREKKIREIISSNSCPHCGQQLLAEE